MPRASDDPVLEMQRASDDPVLEMEWVRRTQREVDLWLRGMMGGSTMRDFQDFILDRERIATLEGQFVEATTENGELRSRLAFVEAENGRLRAQPVAGSGQGGVGTLAIATNELIERNKSQGERIRELEAELAERDGSRGARIRELEAELAERDGSQRGRIRELEAEVARLSAPGSFMEKMMTSQSLMESLQKNLADALSTGASRAELEAARREAVKAQERAEASAKELEAARREAGDARERAEASAKELEAARREAGDARERAEASAKELEAARREAGDAQERAEASAKELEAARREAEASSKELEAARREAVEAQERAEASANELEAAKETMRELEAKVESAGKGACDAKKLTNKLKKVENENRNLARSNVSISQKLEELEADMETIKKVKTKEVGELKARISDLEGKIRDLEEGAVLQGNERDGLKRKVEDISKELLVEREKRCAVKMRADEGDRREFPRMGDREALGRILSLANAVLDGGCAAESIRSATDEIARAAEERERAATLLVRDSDGED